jgi:hypothetical protein
MRRRGNDNSCCKGIIGSIAFIVIGLFLSNWARQYDSLRADRAFTEEECTDWVSHPGRYHAFTSQFTQDRWLYQTFFKHFVHTTGSYLDTSVQFPRYLSNTYFYDKCLHWEGMCVGLDPVKANSVRATRTCYYENKCISATDDHQEVWTSPSDETVHERTDTTLDSLMAWSRGDWKSMSVECDFLSEIVKRSDLPIFVDLWVTDGSLDEFYTSGSLVADIILAKKLWKGSTGALWLEGNGYINYGQIQGLSPVDALFIREDSIWKACHIQATSNEFLPNQFTANCSALTEEMIRSRHL